MYKILIVEDTLAIREEIFDILMMEGYEAFEAKNGSIGFEMALKENPDLIISDILMPEMDGFEMFKKLQETHITRSIPLIFLSAKGEKQDIRTGMNLGAEDYLTKPININDLISAVENKIKKKVFVDQKIINQTKALSNILQNQENELDTYAHLISHELKASLRNVSDILTWTQEDAAETTNCEHAIGNLQLMREKIERMELLLANLEHHKNITSNSFKNKIINAHTIVQKVITTLERPPHISITITNQLPDIFADEHMLEKVFKILIQNAIDYNDKKKGIIKVSCDITEKYYVFSIKDNGVGIPEKYHKKIFEMFQVIQSSESTGIGLSIAKKIVSYYKGDIYVESTAEKETIFSFNIPRK
jgi:light-regulated signal transduction histidine kinase (bacteriophytochrome)